MLFGLLTLFLRVRKSAVVICLTFVLLCSCSPKIYPSVSDSVRVEIRERVIHDSVYVNIEKQVEVNVTRDSTSHLENDYAESDAVVKDGLLHHTLSSRPQRIYVPYTVTVHDTTMIEKQAQTIIQKENYVTKWQSFSMILGWILGSMLILLIALWCVKKYFFK